MQSPLAELYHSDTHIGVTHSTVRAEAVDNVLYLCMHEILCVCVHVCVCVCVCVCMCVCGLCVCMCVCLCVCMCVLSAEDGLSSIQIPKCTAASNLADLVLVG